MPTAALIYPHQLFDPHPAVAGADAVFLVEDPLFFRQYRFHRQKLILHRATMKRYAREVIPAARYIDAHALAATADVVRHVNQAEFTAVRVVDPNDDWLARRLTAACAEAGVRLTVLDDPHFLTPRPEIDADTAGRDRLFFTDFYIRQRKRLGVLVSGGKPVGGKWSFDTENRRKLPAKLTPPAPAWPAENEYVAEARQYVRAHFPDAVGDDTPFVYPTSAAQARAWLADFLEHRFAPFGEYEDAISARHSVLFHSLLTPALNVGLLSPREVLDAALGCQDRVPMNSLEGFVRQVIGWREFVRLVYRTSGRRQRTLNFWGFSATIPPAFYTASTGIEPVDAVIRRVLATGYCHHIERLMILGGFMLLCGLHPDGVYRWFMELFVDAYDWVMVPNVYGMSQFADGGRMTTKPYVCGSNYVRKMGDYNKGDWCAIWDALYWRFVDRHAAFFADNPRTAVMVRMRDKLGAKMADHRRTAEQYLTRLGVA
ncbi:MAG: cryptochrome/photolyase family protein [Gemmataceae bacterium]